MCCGGLAKDGHEGHGYYSVMDRLQTTPTQTAESALSARGRAQRLDQSAEDIGARELPRKNEACQMVGQHGVAESAEPGEKST